MPLDQSTNEQLPDVVRRAQLGKARAFEKLVERCERMVLAVAFATLGDAHAAGDVAQETFLKAWQRLGELQRPEAFDAWICGIARNLAIDQRRRRKPDSNAITELPIATAAEPSVALDDDERQQVTAALAELDEISRAVVVFRYYQDMGSREIAGLLDLSPAAVDMRLSRARTQLRQRLGKMGMENAQGIGLTMR